jgi:hypothetical protein
MSDSLGGPPTGPVTKGQAGTGCIAANVPQGLVSPAVGSVLANPLTCTLSHPDHPLQPADFPWEVVPLGTKPAPPV